MVYGLREPELIKVYTRMVDECMSTMAKAVNPGPHFLLEVVPACTSSFYPIKPPAAHTS
jgi:hypothetical protein